jgi:hypothetical protein
VRVHQIVKCLSRVSHTSYIGALMVVKLYAGRIKTSVSLCRCSGIRLPVNRLLRSQEIWTFHFIANSRVGLLTLERASSHGERGLWIPVVLCNLRDKRSTPGPTAPGVEKNWFELSTRR